MAFRPKGTARGGRRQLRTRSLAVVATVLFALAAIPTYAALAHSATPRITTTTSALTSTSVGTPALSTATTTVTAGSTVTFSYSAPSGQLSTSNWVGWYAAGNTPGNEASTIWKYTQTGTTTLPTSGSTPVASGTVSFSTAGLAPGEYTVYLLYDDGYTVIGSPVTITVQAAALSTATPTVTAGSTVTFNYSAPSGQLSTSNWVGWYAAGNTPGNEASTIWKYTQTGTTTLPASGSTPVASGTVSFDTTGLKPGTYTVYFLYDDGYTAIGSPITVTVQSATAIPGTLSSTTASATAGAHVAFDYTMPSSEASPSNSVAWFPAGADPSTAKPLYAFSQSAASASGTVTFDTTGLAGADYGVYLLNASDQVIAGPVQVAITNNGPQLPSPGQLVGRPNLIVNGGAEIGDGTLDGVDLTTVPGWSTTGLLNEVQYGAVGGNGVGGFPTYSTPGSADRGQNFFSGGGGGVSTGSQTIDLSRAADQIDQGNVRFNLGGWIGGTGSVPDTATVTATFLNGEGRALGTATLDPVTPAMRDNTTEFLPENAGGTLPKQTRSVQIVLTITGPTPTDRSGHGQGYADNLSFTISSDRVAAPPPPTPPVATVPRFDHVFVVMMENQNYGDIIGSPQAPYLNSLLPQAANLTNMYGLTHPSDPNYTGMASGSLYGQTVNTQNAQIGAQQIGDLVSNAGGTWRAYMQSANGPCDLGSQSTYTIDDTPFHNFQDVANNQAACQEHEQPLSQMAVDLKQTATTPQYAWFSANDCYDMEGCGIKAGDTWLSQTLPTIFNSPAWTQQRSLLIITWDEDAANGQATPQRIPTLILGSQGLVRAGSSSAHRYTLYSLLRTTEAALNLPSLTANDAFADPINDIWTRQQGDGGHRAHGGGEHRRWHWHLGHGRGHRG